ncbi:4'-phosphopantetheinyl transferase family protein [Nocardiopsis suaedae]|uniref:4'-phosphopantetheinyl transferase superfamily protein n=1 Tax=Nocardiopsis suaedae TaxID=3018444 RepID=A0ABT4TKC3_9ACTN|nr:4'-phosphopantetheinyl transferase superfamily protein [Nocardiopsis suaedae]MDA2804831.1 4'-phosphopantetheinyl transferase superfamily protein [Nocardiopsis suaedae]
MSDARVHCDIWWATPALAHPALERLLDARERERHARFRRQADRDRYIVAHALARLAVAREAGCAPAAVAFDLHCRNCDGADREPHGKPVPAGPAAGLEVSISHSGDRVALAVARGVPVGVDVEEVSPRRDTSSLAEMALAPAEREALAALPADRAAEGFFTYWARKEALLKASGEGIYAGLAAVEVSSPAAPGRVLSWASPGAPPLGRVRLVDLDAGPRYRAALAVLSADEPAVAVRDAGPLLAAAASGGEGEGHPEGRQGHTPGQVDALPDAAAPHDL